MRQFVVIIFVLFCLTGCISKGEGLVVKKLNIPIQTDNKTDGLYLVGDKYIYRGQKPNNYIKFNDQLFRIISFMEDGRIKIKASNINLEDSIPFDIENKNDWGKSSLRKYLNDNYYNSLGENLKSLIISHDWEIGQITNEVYEKVLIGKFDLLQENEEKTRKEDNIGLLTLSDYSSSLLNRECLMNNKGCPNNYIYDEGISWTLNTHNEKEIWIINYATGFSVIEGTNYTNFNIEPVFYLKSGLTLSGNGTIEKPFVIE